MGDSGMDSAGSVED